MKKDRSFNFEYWAAFGGPGAQDEIGNFSIKNSVESLDKLINNIKPYFWLETITTR